MICSKCRKPKREQDRYKLCRRCREQGREAKRLRSGGKLQRPGRPTLTPDEYEAIEDGTTGISDYDRGFVDEWLPVCERCGLDDCIRHAGELQVMGNNTSHTRLINCAIYAAEYAGYTAKQTLCYWDKFNLLPPERR